MTDPPSQPPPAATPPSLSPTAVSPPRGRDTLLAGLPVAPVDVTGRLTVTCEGRAMEVTATGRKIVVNAPDFASLQTLLKQRPPSSSERGLADVLERLDVDIEIHCKGNFIARVGADAQPGWIEKMLQIKGVDISARGLFKSWLNS